MNRYLGIFLLIILCSIIVSGCSKSPEEKRSAYLASANEYMQEEKYAEAAIQFQNALQIAPDDADTLITLGEVQLKLMRANEAYKAFLRAAQADPKNVKSREYLASMQLLAKKYDLASQQASELLEIDPENRIAKEMLAQALFQSGNQQEAVEIMEGLLKDGEPSEATIINVIQMYLAIGRIDDALDLVAKGTSLYPDSTKIRFLASDIYVFKDNIELAKKWAQDAYRVGEDDINVGLALARFYASHKMDDLFTAQIMELKTKFPDNPNTYMLEAGIIRQKGDLDGALNLAQKARELDDNTLSRTLLSQILLEKGDIDAAKTLLIETAEKDQKAIPSRILLAQIYVDESDPAKALETLDQLIRTIPRRPDVAATAAKAYLMKGDATRARELVEGSLQENKNNVSLHAMMAKIHFAQRQYKETLEEVDLLVKNSITMPDIIYIGALSALRTKDADTAQTLVEKLRKGAPDAWPTLHASTLLFLSKGDKKGAYEISTKAIERYPQKAEALTLYASIASAVVKKDEVIQKVSAACAQADTAPCHMILAGLMESAGKQDDALVQIKEAIALEPDNEILYHALAQFYARTNRVSKALDEYESILNKNPDDLKAAMMLALINQNQGRITDAKKVYNYILEREPKNALAANNLAWILAEGGKKNDLNEALKLAQIAKDKFPDDPRIADTLGFVYLKKGLFENALAQFQLAIEKLSEEPSINYHMALALVELNRAGEAKGFLKKALDTTAPFEEKVQAQQLLARLESEQKE
ncbi:MAG TPA: tetratricopeptide repeat protein [Deltaproteobacteria bacterium]|nr:tetratricopeptide repeat protein [Deltaproteobacteria bacterium]